MSDRFSLDTNIFIYELSKHVPSKQAVADRLVQSGLGILFYKKKSRRWGPSIEDGKV